MRKPMDYLTLKRLPLRSSPIRRILRQYLNVRYFFKFYGAILLFFLISWGIVSQTQLRECLSDSLKDIHYILFLKSSTIKRGDIVAIQGYREDHIKDLKKWPYAKRVLGIPGDHIFCKNSHITVIPQESFNLPLLTQTRKGKPLTPLVPLKGMIRIIPEGYLFVAGDHLQSFDSRYEEFGLVPQEKVYGKAILTW